MTDWDDAFDNIDHVPNALGYFDIWAKRAEDFRATYSFADLNMHYGDTERERLDIFWPESTPKGLAIFIHGGYWKRLDRSYFSDLAKGPLAHGWAVAMPSYTLAPNARINQMTTQIAAAIQYAASKVNGPIRIAGHSAGGHLATRMICQHSPLDSTVQNRIENTLSISGLHDLRNLCKTTLNDTLNLSQAEAIDESPVLNPPLCDAKLTCWVGGIERPEFIRQSQNMVEIWGHNGADTTLVIAPEKHHFDVIDGLSDPQSTMTTALLG